MKNNNFSGDLFIKLIEIMKLLRSDNGCPWDREQTHKSIKTCLVEETYEVLEAIDLENPDKLKEELGDLLLQVIFHSQIAVENNDFSVEDVVENIIEKLVRRHPHVFADEKFDTKEEVLTNWEKIKQKEKKNNPNPSILDGIPKSIPSLLRAHRIQDRVARVGFDWKHIDDVYKKLEEEINEFNTACKEKNKEAIIEELGDVFFTLVNIARFVEADPEEALQKTIRKFIKRFQFIEYEINKKNLSFDDYNLMQLENLWEEAKKVKD